MHTIKDAPQNCVCPSMRGELTCGECYWSQVEDGQWRGSQACWDSQCLVLDEGGREGSTDGEAGR